LLVAPVVIVELICFNFMAEFFY